MEFEPSQAPGIVGPLFTEQLLSDVPLFGPEKADVKVLVREALHMSAEYEDLVVDETAAKVGAGLDLTNAVTVADKLRALRLYSQELLHAQESGDRDSNGKKQEGVGSAMQRERHERFLSEKMESLGLPREGHAILDHVMLLRAKEKYLFSTETNQRVVDDDPWLQDVWGWVAGMSRFTRKTAILAPADGLA